MYLYSYLLWIYVKSVSIQLVMTLLRIQYLLLIVELVFVGVDGVGEGEVLGVPQCASVLRRESCLLPVWWEWVYVCGGSGRMYGVEWAYVGEWVYVCGRMCGVEWAYVGVEIYLRYLQRLSLICPTVKSPVQ